VSLQLSLIGLFGIEWALLHFENCGFQKYSFQILTQFSLSNNALDVPASDRDVFLLRDACVPFT
jgi:hypothetical protein